jgi:hypothetical protein
MFKSVVQPAMNWLAGYTGVAPPEKEGGRVVPLGLAAAIFGVILGVLAIYVGVREYTQPGGFLNHEEDLSTTRLSAAQLMSIEEMRRIAGQEPGAGLETAPADTDSSPSQDKTANLARPESR